MDYCQNCGAKLPKNTKFCPKFGFKIPESGAEKGLEKNKNDVATETSIADAGDKVKPVAQNTGVSERELAKEKSSTAKFLEKFTGENKNKGIIVGIIIVLVIAAIGFTQTTKFRDMTTFHDDKESQFVGWSNSAGLPEDMSITLSGTRFELIPKNETILRD